MKYEHEFENLGEDGNGLVVIRCRFCQMLVRTTSYELNDYNIVKWNYEYDGWEKWR